MDRDRSTADTADADARVRASKLDRLYFGGLGALTASLVYLVCVWLAYRAVAVPITLCTSAVIAFAGATAVLGRRGWIREAWTARWGGALLLGMSASMVYAFTLVRSPAFTLFMVMHVLATGGMHTSTRWVIAVLLLSIASWASAGFAMFGAGFALAAAGLSCASVTAFIVHVVLMRYLATMERLRARDQQHHEELAAALAAAQQALTERQRAETERERMREQLLHSQKLEAIGTLAGGVAHDMNNVLAVIVGLAELLRERAGGSAPEEVEQIMGAARRGAELTRNLLGFSRRGQYRKEKLDPAAVVAGVVALLSRNLPKGIELVVENSSERGIEGDSAQLSQALINLCLNASDAMNGQGELRIQVRDVTVAGDRASALGIAEGRFVALRVADSGCGMDRDTQSRMFEPFFTTKELGRGTGLGLAMVYGTIANHGGATAVESEVGRGTAITLYLPAVEAVRPAAPAPCAFAVHGGAAAVLVVDDEPMVRSVTRRTLERAGYQVITAGDGAEGVERFLERRADIGLVLLDMAMPIMGGAECFRRLRAIDPEVRVVFVSGYALEQEARDCLAAGALAFVEKPFTTARLLETVARALGERRLDGSQAVPSVA